MLVRTFSCISQIVLEICNFTLLMTIKLSRLVAFYRQYHFYCILCYSCTVVLFNPRKNSQAHVLNACRKTVTSLALAGDGKLLATGECGHMPNVRVWDISDPHNAVQIAEFAGHKYGINCVVSATRNNFSLDIFFTYWIFRSY